MADRVPDQEQTLPCTSAHEDHNPNCGMCANVEQDQQAKTQNADHPARPDGPSVVTQLCDRQARQGADWDHSYSKGQQSRPSQDGRIEFARHQIYDEVIGHGEQL